MRIAFEIQATLGGVQSHIWQATFFGQQLSPDRLQLVNVASIVQRIGLKPE